MLDDNKILVHDKQYDLKILFDLSNKQLDLSEFDKKIDAQLKSYQVAGIDISRFELNQLFPNKQLWLDVYEQKQKKMFELFQEIKDPDVLNFYEKLRPFIEMLNKINNQVLLTDLKPNKISFNVTGSKDGRLTIKKGFLNIFNIAKEERYHIKCDPEFRFVQCDYRSFQPRLAIFLSENEEFKRRFADMKDIYGTIDRDKQKLKFFQIMYGVESSDQLELKPIFELRQRIFKDICSNNKIVSPFGRPICNNNDPEHVIFRNFITTCEADFIFQVAVKLDQMLTGKKSKIKWLFHDSIMFEIHKEETFLLKQIKNIMENDSIFNTVFPIKVQIGKDFGNLTDLS